MTSSRWRLARILLSVVALATLAALWPARLGGMATYVSTHGSSMEPLFRHGDLVVVRSAPEYRAGDVVAYRSRLLDTVVLHRVVATEHGRFVLKGDNNSWLDADRPTTDDLIGRLWLRVPRGGTLASRWTPIVLAAGVLLAFYRASTATVGRRPRSRKTSMLLRPPQPARAQAWRVVSATFAACGVASAVVAVYAFTQPTSVTASSKLPYTQRAEFGYTAPAPTSVYDRGRVETGDPVFLRAAPQVEVTVTYELDAETAHEVSGSMGLSVEISDVSGWHRSLELAAPAPFDGTHAVRSATLDLDELQAMLADVRAATGMGGGTYNLDVVADIRSGGFVGGRPLDIGFAPRLELQLDALRLAPRTRDGGTPTPFLTATTEDVETTHRIANRVDARWLRIPISTLRRVGGAGFVTATIAASLAAITWSRRRPGEAPRLAPRHRRRVVPVRTAEQRDGVSVLEVASMDDLARLADQHQALILHERAPSSDTYHFHIDRTVYRYVSDIDGTVHR
jgi:signal peptidase I